jgi:hypothetical protein
LSEVTTIQSPGRSTSSSDRADHGVRIEPLGREAHGDRAQVLVRELGRKGAPSKTIVARAPLARQKAATRRTTSSRPSPGTAGPPHEPSRLFPSIK